MVDGAGYIGGINSVSSFLDKRSFLVHRMYYVSSKNTRIAVLIEKARDLGIKVEEVSTDFLNSLVSSMSHQGVVLSANTSHSMGLKNLVEFLDKKKGPSLLLMLDQVQDPQNLGACFRSSAAFGVDAIIIPEKNSVSTNTTVMKVASGACVHVPLVKVVNLVRAIKFLQERRYWVYGTSDRVGDKSIVSADVSDDVVWVMGSEAKGMRRLVEESCDEVFKIPVNEDFSTLNVSTAASICLYDTYRKRYANKF